MKTKVLPIMIVLALILISCSGIPPIPIKYNPATLRFDNQRAFDLQGEFARTFTNRSSG